MCVGLCVCVCVGLCVCVCLCVCACECAFLVCFTFYPGLFSSFFGSKGSVKFAKVLESSNCSKGSMCNLGNGPLGSSPHLQIFPISCVCLYSRKRRTFRCSASAALYKSLAVQKCVTSLELRPRKLPGLTQITYHISYRNH